ncbi:hypothetical protein [Aestuariispira insulae]|uniref:Uncharacterized protein n=1 Tax=Aestuariispira insulae TaxID=1461337 RepID=A0A3D9HVE9_9PROT|nr:hypothetical protein [Aestuariispira insulae]RED53361.1 hypothetical protein DFP90_101148 [Aestuariispira insulae]
MDIDANRTAAMLIDQYRDKAWFFASKRADQSWRDNDPEAAAVWLRVLDRIGYLQSATYQEYRSLDSGIWQ